MKHLSDETLQRRLDGALGRVANERVERHLSTCENCGSRLKEWESFYESLVVAPAALPPHLSETVMAAIAVEPLPVRTRTRRDPVAGR